MTHKTTEVLHTRNNQLYLTKDSRYAISNFKYIGFCNCIDNISIDFMSQI
jgi:hypothetical protein